jgi:hypothetical protein
MSEEQATQEEGTWSGLKKTLIGTISTVILGAGTWVGTTLFGGGEDKAEPAPVQQAAPNIIINNTQQQQQAAGGGGTKVIERVVEKPAAEKPKPKKDEHLEKEPMW